MYNKEGRVHLETSAHYKNRLDTNISYYSTDVGTADLVFNITRNGYPLLVSEENADVFLILKNGENYIVDTVSPTDPMNGVLRYTIPSEFLGITGKVTGQLYVAIHGTEDIVTEVEFTFDIKDSVINTIPATDKINEIRTFQDFRENIMQTINEIKTALENGSDYVSQMEATLTSGMKSLNDRSLQIINQLESNATVYGQALTDLKDQSITELDTKANQIKTDVETLNKYDTTNWQKAKLTEDNGDRIRVSDVDPVTLPTGYYQAWKVINAPVGDDTSGSYWNIDVTAAYDGIKQIKAVLSYKGDIYTKNIHKGVDQGWKQLNPNENVRTSIGTLGQEGNVYNDVLKLPAGRYECTIPADAFSVNAPLDPNGGSYIAEIDVTESKNGRKQLRLIANARNDEYRATVHSPNTENPDGVFKGWKKVQNEDEYNAKNTDTGWIDWDTKNGATKRNTTDAKQVKCQYRIITVNGTKTMHLRFNVNNLTTQQAFGSIPAQYVPVEQHFVPRMPVSLHPGAMLVTTEGNLIFYANTQDSSWLPGHYIVGEVSWIIDDVGGGN